MTDVAQGLQQQLERLESLIQELERGPESPLRARTREIVHAVLELHASGLARMMELLAGTGAAGSALREELTRDPLVASLLLLHGLHPDDVETRVRRAVDNLSPMLETHGARLTGLAVDADTVRVTFARGAARAQLASGALRARVEQAIIGAAPDVARVEVDIPEMAGPGSFVPVGAVRLRARREGPP